MSARRARPVALLLAIAVGPSLLGITSSTAALELFERQVYLMGTTCRLATYDDDRASGLARLESILRILEDADRELSTWRADSALSRINRQPADAPFDLNARLCRLFPILFAWYHETGRAFDPGVGRLVEVWGIRGNGRHPSEAALRTAQAASGLDALRVDANACTVTRTRDVNIDSGAFGKGEALDRAAADTRRDASARWLVDLGGQVMVNGTPPGAAAWTVTIAHPRKRSEPAVRVQLTSGSLATSGGSERDQIVNEERIGHIIDPRTRAPAPFAGSVTVWHPSALVADILSTALYVMGPDEGIAWADERAIAACFLVPSHEGGLAIDIRPSRAFERRFRYFLNSPQPGMSFP